MVDYSLSTAKRSWSFTEIKEKKTYDKFCEKVDKIVGKEGTKRLTTLKENQIYLCSCIIQIE
jgi:hypothetical protein